MKKFGKLILLIICVICLFGCTLKKDYAMKYDNKIYYVIDDNDVIHYDDYLMLKEDGTFDKQTNYGDGYEHYIGKYELTKYENNNAIKLTIDNYDNLPIYFKIDDNQIIPYDYNEEEYKDLENVFKSYFGNTWIVDESSKLEYNVDISL